MLEMHQVRQGLRVHQVSLVFALRLPRAFSDLFLFPMFGRCVQPQATNLFFLFQPKRRFLFARQAPCYPLPSFSHLFPPSATPPLRSRQVRTSVALPSSLSSDFRDRNLVHSASARTVGACLALPLPRTAQPRTAAPSATTTLAPLILVYPSCLPLGPLATTIPSLLSKSTPPPPSLRPPHPHTRTHPRTEGQAVDATPLPNAPLPRPARGATPLAAEKGRSQSWMGRRRRTNAEMGAGDLRDGADDARRRYTGTVSSLSLFPRTSFIYLGPSFSPLLFLPLFLDVRLSFRSEAKRYKSTTTEPLLPRWSPAARIHQTTTLLASQHRLLRWTNAQPSGGAVKTKLVSSHVLPSPPGEEGTAAVPSSPMLTSPPLPRLSLSLVRFIRQSRSTNVRSLTKSLLDTLASSPFSGEC